MITVLATAGHSQPQHERREPLTILHLITAKLHNKAKMRNENSLIRNVTKSVQIADHTIDISLLDFSNKLMVVVSEYAKIGTLVLITRDAALNSETQEAVYTVKVLLGKDEAEVHAVARHLAMGLDCSKSILMGLALKDYSPAVVRQIATALCNQMAVLSGRP